MKAKLFVDKKDKPITSYENPQVKFDGEIDSVKMMCDQLDEFILKDLQRFETVEFENVQYPKYICGGNMARFIKPVFRAVCDPDNHPYGLEIGYGKESWCVSLDGLAYDPKFDECTLTEFVYQHKDKFPVDWVFSSHCLEHIPDYMNELRLWISLLKPGAPIMLYLPHEKCEYWKPWKMTTKRHIHQFNPQQMKEIFESFGLKNIFVSDCDAAYSFCVYGFKQ